MYSYRTLLRLLKYNIRTYMYFLIISAGKHCIRTLFNIFLVSSAILEIFVMVVGE